MVVGGRYLPAVTFLRWAMGTLVLLQDVAMATAIRARDDLKARCRLFMNVAIRLWVNVDVPTNI